jgi:putative ABC transport system permease protein
MSDRLVRDLRYAWRRLRRAPGPALFAVVTLALGIGVTVATFSIVYRALWRPLGIAAPDRVVLLGRTNSYSPGPTPIGWREFQAIAHDARRTDALAAWLDLSTALVGRGRAEQVNVEAVTGRYFEGLGVSAERGRLLTGEDDRAEAPPVVVLSDATWRSQFGGDPSIVGSRVKLGGASFDVVGIAPGGFRGIRANGLTPMAAWAPLARIAAIDPRRSGIPTERGARVLTVIGRLKPGETLASATDEFARLGKALDGSMPLPVLNIPGAAPQAQLRYWKAVGTEDTALVDTASQMGRAIVALPTLVLLIACTNIANLVLSRGVARRQEFGVRRALGASRWHLIQEQVVEQAIVVAAGGVAGVALAMTLLSYVSRLATSTIGPFVGAEQLQFGLDAGVLGSAAVAAVLCLIVAGVIPALHLTRDSLRTVMSQGDTVSTPRWRGRANLIAVQVGVSVGLFLIAVVFVRLLLSDGRVKTTAPMVPPGAERVALAPIVFDSQNRDSDAAASTASAIVARLQASPDVESAAAMSAAPFGRTGLANYFSVAATKAGAPYDPRVNSGTGVVVTTSAAMAAPSGRVLSGRDFASTDTASSAPVVLVNEGLALDLFNTVDVVGRDIDLHDEGLAMGRLAVDHDRATIVGVVAGGNESGERRRRDDELYAPLAQQHVPNLLIAARARPGSPAPVDTLRAVVRAVDPELALSFVARGDVLTAGPLAFLGAVATALVTLACLALGLAMAGLYGVLSHVVARRTREMGIRFALGANQRHVATLVIRDGFRPIVEGLFIGLGSAIVIRLLMKRALLDNAIAPIDPLAFALAAVLLFAAGVAASYLPARRAASIQPTEALRQW